MRHAITLHQWSRGRDGGNDVSEVGLPVAKIRQYYPSDLAGKTLVASVSKPVFCSAMTTIEHGKGDSMHVTETVQEITALINGGD